MGVLGKEFRSEKDLTIEAISEEVSVALAKEGRDFAYASNYKEAEKLIAYHACPIGIIEGAMKGIPVIIAHSGPSLSEDIPIIKQLAKRANSRGWHLPIISVDNAVKNLVEAKIDPFLIVTADMQSACADMIKPGIRKKVFVAVPPWVHRQTMEIAMNGRVFIYNTISTERDSFAAKFERKFPIIPSLSASATVGTVAFSIAHMLGCDPIIMSGLDLCYEKKSDVPKCKEILTLSNGRPTILEFIASKMWYESNFRNIIDGRRKIHTSSLMKLEGAEHMMAVDLLSEPCFGDKIPNPFWALEKGYNRYKCIKGGI